MTTIDTQQLLPIMKELAALTKCEQQVFLYCLHKIPSPVYNSGDIQCIAISLAVHPRTVQRALISISHQPHLAACVCARKRQRKWIYE